MARYGVSSCFYGDGSAFQASRLQCRWKLTRYIFGAEGETRTRTDIHPLDPEYKNKVPYLSLSVPQYPKRNHWLNGVCQSSSYREIQGHSRIKTRYFSQVVDQTLTNKHAVLGVQRVA